MAIRSTKPQRAPLRSRPLARAVQGYKGGSKQPAAPVESPDSLRSLATFRIVDLISEGEIVGLVNGLQSVYFDQTPLANPDGSLNFANVLVEQRTGTQDQTVITGFSDIENEIAVGVELKSTAPWTQSITDTTLSAIRLTLGFSALSKEDTSNGNVTGYSISYTIAIATDGGAYVTAYNGAVTGKTTTKYQRSTRLDLPPAQNGWSIQVTRTTANANLATIADTTTIDSYTEIIDALCRYPNSALLAVTGDATQFSSVPARAYDCWGRIVQIPSNYDPTARTYTGVWDGSFKPSWTDNPAWVYYDKATQSRFGLGKLVDPTLINKWALYAIAQYCDGLVPDGKGGTEPRFTCNLYLQQQADAFKLMNDLASIFRGASYWSAGAITTSADMPADPVCLYTQANVIGALFTYSSSPRKTRYTTALVTWNDPANFYQQKVEYVEDPTGEFIARYGIQQVEITAVGCTSQAQARRAGLWAILTSCIETDTVTFSVGLEGLMSAPGQIIRIADPNRAGQRQGGRISSATTTQITVDSPPVSWGPAGVCTVTLPTGLTESQAISSVVGNVITVSTPFSQAPVAEASWFVGTSNLVAQTFRVLSVTEDKSTTDISFTITALLHNASKFGAIDNGTPIQIPKISSLQPSSQPAPASVTVVAIETAGQVNSSTVLSIAWASVDTAVAYTIDYRVDNGEWIPLGKRTGLSVDVQGIQKGDYIARVSAINAAGVVSVPTVSATVTVADQTLQPAMVAAALAAAQEAQESASDALGDLADIASDNLLTPSEKTRVILDWNAINGEAPGIDAQASAFGITNEKSAYDSALNALANYLNSLTSPVGWNNLTGNTTIVGPDFRNYFVTYYNARQTLLNEIATVAKAQADAGVTNAAAAAGAAATAQAEATAAAAQANAANEELATISSDGVLSPVEKAVPIRDYGVIVNDQPGIDAQAVAYGIVAQKSAYDASITALTNYLNSLTSPTGWNNLTGNTTVDGPTFRAAFATVYAARQTLLNAIYAAAQTLANNAQATANQGVGLATDLAVVNGGFDVMPLGYGWTPDAGTGWYVVGGSIGPGQGPNCAVHPGSAANGAYRNSGLIAVQQGQCVKAQALISANGSSNGIAYVYISWCNASGGEIDTSTGNAIAGGNFATGQGSFVIGYAPAGAVYARVCLACVGQNQGNFLFDNVVCTQYPNSVDEVGDGAAFSRISTAPATGIEVSVNGAFSVPAAFNEATNTPYSRWFVFSNTNNWFYATTNGNPAIPLSLGFTANPNYGIAATADAGMYVVNGPKSTNTFGCTPGDVYLVSGELELYVGSAVPATLIFSATINVAWFSAKGVFISNTPGPQISGSATIPASPQLKYVTAPAGAVFGALQLKYDIVNNGSAAWYPSSGYTFVANFGFISCKRIPNLSYEVQGTLSTARNMPQRTVTNIPAKVPSVFSYTANSNGTATVTLAAFTVLSDQNVNYNAMSVGISGGTAGTTVTYYFYFDDPTYAGGTQTLVATTNSNLVYQGAGRVYAGGVAITFPSAGSGPGTGGGGGGGGGSGGGCVMTTQCMPGRRWALGVRKGDYILGTPERPHWLRWWFGKWHRVQHAVVEPQPCVRITTTSGASVAASTTTPMTLRDGSLRMLPDMLSQEVYVRRYLLGLIPWSRWERVVRVQELGVQPVNHISVDGNCYFAGDRRGVYINTHNTIYPK